MCSGPIGGMTSNIRIHEMPRTAEGVSEAVNCLVSGGWGTYRQFQPTFSFYSDESRCQAIVAGDEGGEPVGTAIAIQHGEVGWIGNVFVSPDLRGRGLGEKLTREALQHLRDTGCETIRLVATPLGEPLYRKLGFRLETQYHELLGTGLGRQSSLPTGSRPLLASDLDDAINFDRALTGEDRSHLIRRFWPYGWVLTGSSAAIDGLVIPVPWGGAAALLRPQVVPGEASGFLTLVRSVVGPSSELMAYPTTENVTAQRLLRQEGFVELRTMPRMVLGAERDWEAAALWSIFSPAMG